MSGIVSTCVIAQRTRSILFAAALAAAPVVAGAAQVTVSWIGASGGNWNTGTNWSGGAVPNNGVDTYNVRIDNNAGVNNTVILNAVRTIDNLTIDTGDILSFNNAFDLNVVGTSINNAGSIVINGAGSSTDLIVGTITLSGGGTITLGNSTLSRIIGFGSGGQLTNTDNLIQGGGAIGSNVLVLVNQGTILANQSTALTMDLAAGLNSNTGWIRANGGTLIVNNSILNNSSGTIEAVNSSRITLSGATITGGVLQTSGAGVIEVNTNDGSLTNVTNTGNFVIRNASDAFIYDTITNSGSITLEAAAALTDLELLSAGTVTLAGGGTVNLTGTTNSRILGSGILVSDNYIHGLGSVGGNGIGIVNNNAIAADVVASTMTLDVASSGMSNNGVLRAENGGTLAIAGSNITNSGSLVASGGSTITLSTSTIIGGTLHTAGSGVIRGVDVTLTNLTNAGSFSVPSTGVTQIAGTITNNGSMGINAAGSNTYIHPVGSVTLSGSGVIEMNNSSINWIYGTDTTGHLINSAGHTIRGAGNVGWTNRLQITNAGLIEANQPTALVITPNAGGMTNTGTLRASNNATLRLNGGAYNNTGGTIEATGSSVELFAGAVVSGGILQTSSSGVIVGLDGTLQNLTNAGSFTVPSGAVTQIAGTITNNGSMGINAAGSNTYIRPVGSVTLGGSGVIEMNDSTLNWIYGTDATGQLINSAGHTIRGGGNIGWTNRLKITNAGMIDATQPSALALAPNTGGLLNTGILRASTGNLRFDGSGGGVHDSTGGAIQVLSGGSVTTGSSPTVNAGSVALDGAWNTSNGVITLGAVAGSGSLDQSGGATSVQHLRIDSVSATNGTITILANGGASGTSVLKSLPNMTNLGRLDVKDNDLIIDYSGAPGTLENSTRTQIFSNRITTSLAGTPAGTKLGYGDNAAIGKSSFGGLPVDSDSILIKFTYAGDANLDGQVTISDLGDLASNWQATGAFWRHGDFNYDGSVTISDLGDLASNWQAGVGSPLGMSFAEALAAVGLTDANVPEPGAILVLSVAWSLKRSSRSRR